MLSTTELLYRLLLAVILGGLIGFEREYTHRPAGFRTHILVCVGAALVMVTSEFMFWKYKGIVNMDPARLGAQVITGIGFLGAGTIIHEGFNVKGLTTAASLWTVACIGLAVGIGFYAGAIIVATIIFITLIVLKKIEDNFARQNRLKIIFIQSEPNPRLITSISRIMEKYNGTVKKIEFVNWEKDDSMVVRVVVKLSDNQLKIPMINEIMQTEGIKRVYEE
jgi:putative Mg2+ transporter-C (MgtC) family protein